METVYHGYLNANKGQYDVVSAMTYAIDLMTYNMVVGGKAEGSNGTPPVLFLYYIEETNCRIPWHFHIDGDTLPPAEWSDLAIRDQTHMIYGTVGGTLVIIDTYWPNKPIVLNLFTLPQAAMRILAP